LKKLVNRCNWEGGEVRQSEETGRTEFTKNGKKGNGQGNFEREDFKREVWREKTHNEIKIFKVIDLKKQIN
jgi:hypothetical protein